MISICTNDLKAEITREAKETVRENKIAPIHPSGYHSYLEKGNRLFFERQYFARRRQLVTLGLDLLLHQREDETVSMLEAVIWEICNEYSWALPAHLDVTKEGQFDQNSPCMIDLFAGETAQSLAEILEVHQEKLSPLIQGRIRQEVERRIFSSLETKEWHWEKLENNWSAVIAGSVGMAALSLLEQNSPRQQVIINRLETSFQHYLNGFSPDGACEEGVGYWAYGFGYYLYFAEKYNEVYADEKYLNRPHLKEIAAFPERIRIGLNNYAPFSDTGGEERLPSGLLSFCHKTFHVPVPPVSKAPSLHFDHCYRWAHLYRNLIWTDPVVSGGSSTLSYFPDVQWVVAKQQEKFVFAAKGGKNNESHNHNDVGHFVLGVSGELLLTDLGAGEYTREYFQEETRYQILNNCSFGHSVPVINQCEQQAGEFGATDVSLVRHKEGFTFSLEMGDVYPKEAGFTSFRRSWEVYPEEWRVTLQDWITFPNEERQTVQSHLVSIVKPEVEKNAIYWEGEKGVLRLTIPSFVEEVSVLERKTSDHDGEMVVVYLTVFRTTCKKEYKQLYEFSIVERRGNYQNGL